MKHIMRKASECPGCQRRIDMHTPADGQSSPGPNDFSICLYCNAISVYTDDMTLRAATDEERETVESLPEFQNVPTVQKDVLAWKKRQTWKPHEAN